MASPIKLTVIYEPVENGWTQARVKELPGVITVAATAAEAKVMVEDAIREYLLAQLEDGKNGSASAQEEHVELIIGA
jgi:predicted RNase H-like HicB family nuclease